MGCCAQCWSAPGQGGGLCVCVRERERGLGTRLLQLLQQWNPQIVAIGKDREQAVNGVVNS